ncbi:hypothetical protein [uncultured Psychroserpens sp.]|uniref:hypothetical protein n=1 Tax=uncultured Psychroserpens sp. TaxID=255436 RepID=UPI0026246EC0|nr:hypothetical protein [uncultured Psychroserpens sp.]
MSNSLRKGALGGGLAVIIFGFIVLFKFYDALENKYLGMACGVVMIVLGILGIRNRARKQS